MTGRLYLERLTERDLTFLATAVARSDRAGDVAARLRAEPARIEELVGRSEVFDALFAPWSDHPFLVASPFLVFSVLVSGVARSLETARFVRDWVGPRQRVPVFDVASLREFLDDPARQVFLADVLASYTHVASGVVWVKDRRGWSRRRFSELDPGRLAALLDVVPEAQRPAIYRRIGDLALFLGGVFPDFAADRLLRPVQLARLERVLASAAGGDEGAITRDAISVLERLGRRSYRAVVAAGSGVDLGRVLEDVAERFADARRVLNVLTDSHLFPVRDDWFASP